jgi:exonuclease SbcD
MITTLAGEINDGLPAILLGHFTVSSAIYGSETGMSAGDDAEVMVETLVNEAWDYVALGHLHLHQDMGTKDFPIVYAGSLDKVDFSEENDPKGFIWIEIDENGTRWEQIGIDSRPFVTLEMDVSGEENHTKTIISKIKKHDLKDAVVRVLIETEEGSTETINRKRIYEVLDNAGVNYVYNVIIKEKPSTRSRLDESVDLTAMSHPQMLKTYFQTIGTPKSEIKELMSLAKDIMEEVNADQSL